MKKIISLLVLIVILSVNNLFASPFFLDVGSSVFVKNNGYHEYMDSGAKFSALPGNMNISGGYSLKSNWSLLLSTGFSINNSDNYNEVNTATTSQYSNLSDYNYYLGLSSIYKRSVFFKNLFIGGGAGLSYNRDSVEETQHTFDSENIMNNSSKQIDKFVDNYATLDFIANIELKMPSSSDNGASLVLQYMYKYPVFGKIDYDSPNSSNLSLALRFYF